MKKPAALIASFLLIIFFAGCGNSRISVNESIEELQEKVKNDPNNEIAHYSLGIGYISENKYPEAISAFKKALEINGHFSEAHYAIYCVEQAMDDDLAEEMDKDEPDKEYIDKINELNKHFTMALMSSPFFERKLGFLLMPSRERAETAEEMELYDLFYSLFYNGYENYITSNYEGAITDFTRIINEMPATPDERQILKDIAKYRHKSYDRLLKEYKEDAQIFRGKSYAANKDYASAIKDFVPLADSINSKNKENMLAEYDNPSIFYFYIGYCYLQLNNFSEAEKALQKTLTEDYSKYMAHYYLAEIYHKQKRYNDALSELDAALLVAPEDPLMHYNKAVFL
ncbi:MAG TPA: tetratricopeptide repeat protein, partial [Ignavibacteriales bacterium]|nr:tetratricopeptide repeat protein [Ignavibacteriales bacterium]